MPPIVRQAKVVDARAVQDILIRISWIHESTKSEDGLEKLKECCGRGEVWITETSEGIFSMMILRPYSIAASRGYKILQIPIIATIETERRQGYARRLIRKAKEIAAARDAALEAYPENRKSLDLLCSEGFEKVEGRSDESDNPLYSWSSDSRVGTLSTDQGGSRG